MFHTPDAAPLFVALRMISRHFVVGNYFVVPIHDVETAIRPEMNGNRTEHLVAGFNEVGQFLVSVTRTITINFDRLNHARDGIGDIENSGVGLGPGTARIREGKAAEAGAAHLKMRSC